MNVNCCDFCGVAQSPGMRMYAVEVLRHANQPDLQESLGELDVCWNCTDEVTIRTFLSGAGPTDYSGTGK